VFCSRRSIRAASLALIVSLMPHNALAQQSPPGSLEGVLDRLDALEKQNQELLTEIRALREQLKNGQAQTSPPAPALEDRVDVAEQRIKEHAETKVSASQKFPLSITGMFLFDSYIANGTDNPAFLTNYGDYSLGAPGGGATLRQSILGLDFQGPHIFADGRINGSLSMDFFNRSGSDDVLRIRRGTVSFDWSRRSIVFGQDKPIISPLQPSSFARVGIPPLSGAGNLWLWLPQVTYVERVPFSSATRATIQTSLIQTDETYSVLSSTDSEYVAPSRPAIEARFELQHTWKSESKITVGIGGHASTSHILGQSIPSRVISADLAYKPLRWLELSSTLLHGENFANLGGIPPGVTVVGQSVTPIHGTAGWLQLAFPITNRLTVDIYAGRQQNQARDLSSYEISRTLIYAGNVLYRCAPNVVLGFEASPDRLQYLNKTAIASNRYDATVAYLF